MRRLLLPLAAVALVVAAATRLHLSEETVKSHLRHASARNGARNRTHLAVMFATGRLRVVDTRHR